jgi:hypothetical protein
MAKALSHISHEAPRPPDIIRASSDHALDEFLPEAELTTTPVALPESPLFRHVDERAPAVDLAAYEIQSIAPPPAGTRPSHARAAHVAQALIGALMVVTAVRAYQIYAPAHATEPKAVPASAPPVVTARAAEPAIAQPPVAQPTIAEPAPDPVPPSHPAVSAPPRTPSPPPPASTTRDRGKTPTVANGVVRETSSPGPSRGPAQLNPEAAAAFWGSRGGRASQPPLPPSLPSSGQGPALEGAALAATSVLPSSPPTAPPPPPPSSSAAAKAPVPVANPPAFIAPSSPVRITTPPAAGENAAPGSVASPREVDTALIESVLTQYRTAFANLDASAVEPFWPSVNSRSLSRAFDQLEVQKFEFDRCTTDIKGATAVTTCSGRARYTPRIGNKTPRVEPRRWTFTMEKVNQNWVIRRVDSTRSGS